MFSNRQEAGLKLGNTLKEYGLFRPVIITIPRGGVIVGVEAAKVLDAPMSLVVPRKIGAPFNKEFAIGSVAPDGEVVLNPDAKSMEGLTDEYIENESRREIKEAERRMEKYGIAPIKDLSQMTAIIVDDGIATGYTMLAAARYLKKTKPRMLVIAVPVAPPSGVEMFKGEVDRTIVLHTPSMFSAVGQFYHDFHQVTDSEVIDALSEVNILEDNE